MTIRDIGFYQTAVKAILTLAEHHATSDPVYLAGRLYDIAILANSMRVALQDAADHQSNMTLDELRLLVESMSEQDKRVLRLMLA